MPSASLQLWQSERAVAIQEIQAAHASVGGTERGRRYATQQINQAYVMVLSGQFQGFCRDLHTEWVDYLTAAVSPSALQGIVRGGFLRERRLDKGNPSPGNIGEDFNRLGLKFWESVSKQSSTNSQRQKHLEVLNAWRNAVAHQSFDPAKLGGKTSVNLVEVRQWNSACDGLALAFDKVMGQHLDVLLGAAPW